MSLCGTPSTSCKSNVGRHARRDFGYMKRITHNLILLYLCTFWLILPINPTAADSVTSRNAFTLEAFGSGIIYSANYENSFNSYSFLRVGLSIHSVVGVPILYNLRFGGTSHQFIIGAGIVPYFESGSQGWQLRAYFSGNIGYRWVLSENIFSQISFTPLISFCGDSSTLSSGCPSAFFPWGGLTLGYLF